MNEPPLYAGDEFFLTAFYTLSTGRTVGSNSISPIPWRDIAFYADRFGLDRETSVLFEYIIQELDAVYLTFAGERLKRELSNKGK